MYGISLGVERDMHGYSLIDIKSTVTYNENYFVHNNDVLNQQVFLVIIFHHYIRELRSYPPRFGLKMAQLYPRFLASRPYIYGTRPDLPSLGIELFASMPWETADLWEDAKMESVFRYLRASYDLRLDGLRHLFPTEM